jgi:hypothetical protein
LDPRLSHALVAVVAVLATVSFYEISEALEETARAVSHDVGEKTVAAYEADRRREERERSRDADASLAKLREEARGARQPADPRAEPREEGLGKLAERAEERGMSPEELLALRAERRGVSVEEYQERMGARREIREEKGSPQKDERRPARTERRPVAPADLEAREARRAAIEADPSLRDAATVMRKLREMGDAVPVEGQPAPAE